MKTMRVYPQFIAYSAWTTQNYRCFSCSDHVHAQQVREENLLNGRLACDACVGDVPTGASEEDSGRTRGAVASGRDDTVLP